MNKKQIKDALRIKKTFKCDKCKEQSSVKIQNGGHLCIDHYLAMVEA